MKKIFLVVVLLICFAIIGFKYLIWGAYSSVGSVSNVAQIFEIKAGERTKQIAENLKQQGLISNKYFFYYYLYKNNLSGQIQAGKYELTPNMTIAQISQKIITGDVVSELVRLTIPEGFTNKKIVARLKTLKPSIASDFEKYINCKCINQSGCDCDNFSGQYAFIKQLPKGVDLEGYLFPDTYFIDKTETAETLVQKFLNNFNRQVYKNLQQELQIKGKNLNEIITMASVIEKEVKTEKDRTIVSGIFWNRIKDNHPLQSCATLAYVLEEDKKQYSLEDTQVVSAYNTYLNSGFPPGPVSNAGLASIKAALNPAITDYYFFLSDPNTGETIFSKTAQEHAQNKIKHGL